MCLDEAREDVISQERGSDRGPVEANRVRAGEGHRMAGRLNLSGIEGVLVLRDSPAVALGSTGDARLYCWHGWQGLNVGKKMRTREYFVCASRDY